MTFFQQLQQQTRDEQQYLLDSPLIGRALAGAMTLDEYRAFLIQAYHHVRHTTPLLMAVGSRISHEQEWLREAVAEYIEEELGHQEWVLNDIAACGLDKEKVRNSQPDMACELMISYAWDTVQRVNPLGFFGMVHVLEGTSIRVADQAADAIQHSLQLPDRAFSYLRSHGALDQQHVQFFASLMNRIDQPADQQQIVHCARRFYLLYGNIFRTLSTDNIAQLQQAA
ncbi:MAG TPA: iron-containing redox enzyme family protein [Pseudomonadales bacterium]